MCGVWVPSARRAERSWRAVRAMRWGIPAHPPDAKACDRRRQRQRCALHYTANVCTIRAASSIRARQRVRIHAPFARSLTQRPRERMQLGVVFQLVIRSCLASTQRVLRRDTWSSARRGARRDRPNKSSPSTTTNAHRTCCAYRFCIERRQTTWLPSVVFSSARRIVPRVAAVVR